MNPLVFQIVSRIIDIIFGVVLIFLSAYGNKELRYA